MTRFALIIALAVVPMEPLFGQLDQIWQADFDGTALAQEEILASTVDISGNLIVTGCVRSPRSDVLVAKYNSAGVELWREYFDSPDHDSEVGRLTLPPELRYLAFINTALFRFKERGGFMPSGVQQGYHDEQR